MTGKEVPRRGVPWTAVGLAAVAVVFVYRLALSGAGAPPPPPRLNQEQLELLALSLGATALPSTPGGGGAAAGSGAPRQWGPSVKPGSASSRGGKYVITSVMGLDPERLNIFVASLRRYSPSTHLVVFVEEQTDAQLLKDAGAEVIPFKQPAESALVLHRCARGAGRLAVGSVWLPALVLAGGRRRGTRQHPPAQAPTRLPAVAALTHLASLWLPSGFPPASSCTRAT